MRRLVWAIIVLAVIWCVWWVVASTGLERAVQAGIDDRNNTGWQVDVEKMSKRGFPLKLQAHLEGVSIADRASGVVIDAPQLDLITSTYWPGFMTVALPNRPVQIVTPVDVFTLKTQNAKANLRLRPQASLQLQSLSFVSDAWEAESSEGSLFSADDLSVSATQDTSSPLAYQFDLNATRLAPGPNIRAALSLPIDWPIAFEAFTADIQVGFDKAWDRSVVNAARPQPRSIAVRSINAVWGQLNVGGSGDLTIDPSGILTGAITISIGKWRKILEVAEASGALSSAQRVQVEFMGNALANLGNDPNNLNLILSFQNGQMSLGPITLGPAPRLILR